MKSLFTQVKTQVTARQAAERYGVFVNRSGMACCIFHDDRHPSMKIDRRFYCFACHATGDAIDFTARLFDLSPYEAARKLARDFGIHVLPQAQSAPVPKISERQEEQRVLGLFIDYERLLKKRKEMFAPSVQDDTPWDARFCQAVHCLTLVDDAIGRLLSADPDERKAMMDCIHRSNAVTRIERILNEEQREAKNNVRSKERTA